MTWKEIDAPFQDPRPLVLGIVLMIGAKFRLEPEMRDQRATVPGVLAIDDVGGGKRRQCPQRDVAEIADRRRDNVEARRQRLAEQAGKLGGGALGQGRRRAVTISTHVVHNLAIGCRARIEN